MVTLIQKTCRFFCFLSRSCLVCVFFAKFEVNIRNKVHKDPLAKIYTSSFISSTFVFHTHEYIICTIHITQIYLSYIHSKEHNQKANPKETRNPEASWTHLEPLTATFPVTDPQIQQCIATTEPIIGCNPFLRCLSNRKKPWGSTTSRGVMIWHQPRECTKFFQGNP